MGLDLGYVSIDDEEEMEIFLQVPSSDGPDYYQDSVVNYLPEGIGLLRLDANGILDQLEFACGWRTRNPPLESLGITQLGALHADETNGALAQRTPQVVGITVAAEEQLDALNASENRIEEQDMLPSSEHDDKQKLEDFMRFITDKPDMEQEIINC